MADWDSYYDEEAETPERDTTEWREEKSVRDGEREQDDPEFNIWAEEDF